MDDPQKFAELTFVSTTFVPLFPQASKTQSSILKRLGDKSAWNYAGPGQLKKKKKKKKQFIKIKQQEQASKCNEPANYNNSNVKILLDPHFRKAEAMTFFQGTGLPIPGFPS